MLLTIPSHLDCLCPETEQYEVTQVEVSIAPPGGGGRDSDGVGSGADGRSTGECYYSVVVMSEESVVQSVVAIPRRVGEDRRGQPQHRHHHQQHEQQKSWRTTKQRRRSASAGDRVGLGSLAFATTNASKDSAPPSRMADSLRPRSPVPKDRSSAFDGDYGDRGFRRESRSCPPTISRRRRRHNHRCSNSNGDGDGSERTGSHVGKNDYSGSSKAESSSSAAGRHPPPPPPSTGEGGGGTDAAAAVSPGRERKKNGVVVGDYDDGEAATTAASRVPSSQWRHQWHHRRVTSGNNNSNKPDLVSATASGQTAGTLLLRSMMAARCSTDGAARVGPAA